MHFENSRSDIQEKRNRANNYTYNVGGIVSVAIHVTDTLASLTAMLVRFERAGKSRRDRIFYACGCFCWWNAGGAREEIDELEDEEFGKCSAKVGDTVIDISFRI